MRCIEFHSPRQGVHWRQNWWSVGLRWHRRSSVHPQGAWTAFWRRTVNDGELRRRRAGDDRIGVTRHVGHIRGNTLPLPTRPDLSTVSHLPFARCRTRLRQETLDGHPESSRIPAPHATDSRHVQTKAAQALVALVPGRSIHRRQAFYRASRACVVTPGPWPYITRCRLKRDT